MKTRYAAKAKGALIAILVLLSGEAHADAPLVMTLVPKHVFVARGFSVRHGDLFVIEPSLLFVPWATPGSQPIVFVARSMLGLGGSGIGIGLATNPLGPIDGADPVHVEDYVSILPMSVEVHVERTYGPSSWRSATYLGPHFSFSVLVLKLSGGWMFNATDRTDEHLQLGIGAGF